MNNEISSKSLSLSSVDATLAAIIPDTPIVSIAGSTLSEITTTTTSTTTTPTPTPTSYETNKVDISSSSSVAGLSIPSMSGVSPKIAGAATNRATASSLSTSNSNSITKDDSTTIPTIDDLINSNISPNIDASNSNHDNTTNPPKTANIIDTVTAGATNTGATTKSTPITVASTTGNTKSEANATEKKSKDSELWEEEKFTNLDDQNLKLLLEEAYSYRSPTDKENKSELFLSLLEKAENEKEDITLCRMPTSSRLKRISYTTHNYHQQHHHHRHKHGGSLQDLDEAVRNETIIDPDDLFSSSCGQRNRRNNHNSRQKKYSTTVSSRQREGGSLPNNVNFTNCARLFGVGGTTTGGDVAGIAPIDQQFPFMHEINTVTSGTVSGTTVVVAAAAAAAGSACSSNSNSANNNNNNTNSSGVIGNNSKQQRRTSTRTNAMSSTSLASTPSTASAAKIEAEQLVGQPIGVLIGGQVITPKASASIASNGSNNSSDTANGSILSTGSRTLKDTICSVNVGDCVIEMGETIIDVQQQQQILQSKSQEAISQGRVYYDRLDTVELMPRSNMMSAVPSRTCFGPTTANAYVDEKVHFTALRNYNPSAVAASGGSKTNQVGGVDTKYLPLGDDYKAYKSVLAIADKEDMREVDENGNAVTETFSVNTTNTHATTATVYNSINVTSAPVIASASTNSGGSTQATKSKSKKQPKQERNVTTVNVEAVAGYRGTDPVEKLVEYIESTTGDDNKNKQRKERKKQEKQDKHSKIKKSNSLEELRSCAKMEVDELKRTAATTESNVMMRNKGKGGKNNSSSAADINKNFDSSSSATAVVKDKSANVGSSATTVVTTNRKGERRSWGTEELQYLGDANGNKNANSSSAISVGVNSVGSATSTSATEEKVKEKERKNKNRENQKDRIEDKDKSRLEKVEKVSVDIASMPSTVHNSVAVATNVKLNVDKNEKQNQQVEKPEKAEKRKKGEIQQPSNQQQTKPSVNVSAEPIAVVDVLAMESVLPEAAEFHVVTKKKKTKKQRSSLEESIGMGNNNKSHNFITTTANLKPSGNHQHQSARFNAKFNSNEHSNNNNNGNNNSNHYQQHHSNNHYHNHQQQQQQMQSQQQQHQHQQQNNDKSRRKSTSSVPPSEKSDSSDLDSVHSLPIEKAAKLAGTSSNLIASKTPNKQMRQNKNTAGSAATMSLPQKPQQVQQMSTPFSYAEIAKEAKSLNATITSPVINNVNSSNNNNGAEQAAQAPTVAADSNNSISQQQHPPTMTNEEVKTTPLRGHHSPQQMVTGTTNNISTTTSSTTSSTTTAPTVTTNASNTHSSNQSSNPNANKTNKMKKSAAKTDFPALGSASDVAVAASAARADIFAKAVLNSSQHTTIVQQHQQHNPNSRDIGENTTTVVTTPKSVIPSHTDIAPKDAAQQQQLQVQPQQNQQQHQQTLQKSKSVEHETSSGISSSSNSSYSNTIDHQQYPALKTVKRHSAFNFTTLPPTATTSVASTAGLPTQQHHANNQNATQFNFAAAARQMVTNVPVIANNEISSATASETTTSTTVTTGTTTTAVVSKKNSGAAKEKTSQATSITNVTPISTNEQNTKKIKKEKHQQNIGEATSKTSTTTTALSRKSSAATQTNTPHLGHNEGTGKQIAGNKPIRSTGSTPGISNTNSATLSSATVGTTGVATVLQQIVNQTVPSTNRPAVIILNDDTVGISTDFTFGDFNEDELHFFDDEPEDYAPIATSASGTSDDLIEEHLMPKLTSSSPRSGSISTTSLKQLNDSGSSTELCMVNNNTSGIEQTVSPQTDDILMNSSDGTLSPNNSTLTAVENQHCSSVGLSGGISNSSRSNASGSNHSGDSGIYTSSSKIQEKPAVDTSNVNTFLQQHLSMANTNPTTNELENSNAETTECNVGNNMHQPRQQQLETCNEIESAIIAAARRAANHQNQQQHYSQKPPAATTAHYQHSNSNSSSFSSSSSVDGGVNRYYSAVQSPPPQSHIQQQQQQQQPPQGHYYNNNRQAYAPYPVHTQHLQQQLQLYHQNYNMLPTSQPQPMMVNTNLTPANIYSRSNSDCDEDFVSPPPGTFVVKIQNKEFDLHYLPPNMPTNDASQNETIVEYVSSVWDEVINSKYTRVYDGQ